MRPDCSFTRGAAERPATLNLPGQGAKMKLEPDKRVQIKVVKSECSLMKTGECVYLDGPMIDYANSAPVCVTALLGIYPFIMTARFGIESEKMGHTDGYHVCCPDKIVEFVVSAVPTYPL
jgi:uncharacterized repeat protein (TIGR04076 family)